MKYGKFAIVIFFTLLVHTEAVNAQKADVKKGSFHFPRVTEFKEYTHEISLILAKLPEAQIEATSNWIYAPLFSYHFRYGLPNNFAVNSTFSTNIITYFFRSGFVWNYEFGNFAFGTTLDIAYWFGILRQFGFDSEVNSWNAFPGVVLGYAFDDFVLTFAAESNYILSIEQKADDITTESSKTFLAGTTLSFFVEQPVWKDNFMSLGLKLNFEKIYWPAWAVFPSWDRYFLIPEVFIGFIL